MELSTTPTLERLRLAQPDARPTTVDRANRRFIARALSGAPIRRYDPVSGREFDLTFDMAGADLSRFNGGVAPLLDSHIDGGIASQLGVVRRAWIESGALLVEVELSSRPQAEALLDDLERGIVRGVSLGIELIEVRDERAPDGKLARRVATRWLPYELSLVSTPADAGAMILSMHGGREMTSEQNRSETFDARACAERLAAQFKLGEDFVSRAAAAKSETEVRAVAFDVMADQYEKAPTRSHVAFIRDQGDTIKQGLQEALEFRMNGGSPSERARPYIHMTLAGIARETLQLGGARLVGISDARVVTLAMSTSDFPQILANVANKTLLAAYQAVPAALKSLCRIVMARDFKTRKTLRVGEGTQLVLKPEGSDYQFGALSEEAHQYNVRTYGRAFRLTRETLINDDLDGFGQWLRALGRLSADFEGQLIVDLLTSNSGSGPVMADGVTMFHANHGNLAGTGGAISVDTVSAARAAMRTRKGLDGGVTIDCDPKFIVVPAKQQTKAEQLVSAVYSAKVDDVNPFTSRLVVLTEPRLDAVSSTAWYLAASPDAMPTLEIGYLGDSPGPAVESERDFHSDDLLIKTRLDIGVGAVDWRPIYKNPGA